MDKEELKKVLCNWEGKYLEIIRENFRKLSISDLCSAMKNLDSQYTDEQLAKYDKERMVKFLSLNYNDPFIIKAYIVLENIQSQKSNQEIFNSVSALKELISKAEEKEITREMNLELVEELERYEEE